MAKVVGKSGGPESKKGPGTSKIRTSDDLELMRLILEENQALKRRVMRHIEKSLGKSPSEDRKS